MYKNTTWANPKESDEVQVEIEKNNDSIKVLLQHALKANILMSRTVGQQLSISQEKFLDMYISSLRKKKAGSFCEVSVITSTARAPRNPIDTKV